MVPIWATGFAAFAVPILLIFFTFAIAPPPEDRKYWNLVLLGIVGYLAVFLIAMALGPPAHSANPLSLEVVKTSLLHASLDNAIIAGGLALWLAGIHRPKPADTIFATVSIAATIWALDNFWLIKYTDGDFASWAALVAQCSLAAILYGALDACLIGLWTALAIARWGDCRRLETVAGFAIAVFADGLWGALERNIDGFPPKLMLMLMLWVGIKAAAIALGLRYLRQAGIRFRWPPSLA
jgi:hypothetical protein